MSYPYLSVNGNRLPVIDEPEYGEPTEQSIYDMVKNIVMKIETEMINERKNHKVHMTQIYQQVSESVLTSIVHWNRPWISRL